MTIKYNLTGADRKKLVQNIAEILASNAQYLGAPTFAYKVGTLTIDKNGSVAFENSEVTEEIKNLFDRLEERGFVPETAELATEGPSTETEELSETLETEPHSETPGLTVEIPLECVAVGNLTKLLEIKGDLIKKALGVDDLQIEVTENTVKFPWFDSVEPECVPAYTHFITALCEFSKNQKRINTTTNDTDNEKYTFRCFLMRLGFIGSDTKSERKILSRNLSGCSAFRNGIKKTEETA